MDFYNGTVGFLDCKVKSSEITIPRSLNDDILPLRLRYVTDGTPHTTTITKKVNRHGLAFSWI